MTSIKLMLTGAQAWAVTNGPLTSGMVGVPVIIEYDEAWDGLTKNLMCRCSPWGSNEGEIRTILNVGDTSTVAHEVMQAGMYLHLGVEGFNADGKLVMPTTWARCGKIEYGANTCDDLSTEPELPIWNQLQTEVEQIKRDGYTQEQIDEIQAYVQSAVQAASNAERSKDNAVAASNVALSNAASARNAADTAQTSAENASASAGSAANLANGALQAQRAAEAAAERAEAAADAGGGAAGLPAVAKTVLGNIMTILKAQVEDEGGTPQGYSIDVNGLFAQNDELIAALGGSGDSGETPEKILVSISAVYSGGPVPAGTALKELSGVVVTAHYGDGTSADVTDYTLSGVIAEGSNTIVVSYGGMTATFEVVGTGSTVYLKDAAQFDPFVIRKALTQNDQAGAWSVELPYTEGMTVSGCVNPGWKGNYAIAIITDPDGTQYTSFDADTVGAALVEGTEPITQYTATLTGYAEGSTVRVNMYMGSGINTEELARAFATSHKEYLYYEPGEV